MILNTSPDLVPRLRRSVVTEKNRAPSSSRTACAPGSPNVTGPPENRRHLLPLNDQPAQAGPSKQMAEHGDLVARDPASPTPPNCPTRLVGGLATRDHGAGVDLIDNRVRIEADGALDTAGVVGITLRWASAAPPKLLGCRSGSFLPRPRGYRGRRPRGRRHQGGRPVHAVSKTIARPPRRLEVTPALRRGGRVTTLDVSDLPPTASAQTAATDARARPTASCGRRAAQALEGATIRSAGRRLRAAPTGRAKPARWRRRPGHLSSRTSGGRSATAT